MSDEISIILPEDMLKLIFQQLDLQSSIKASITCHINSHLVWLSFEKITTDFFPRREKGEKEAQEMMEPLNESMKIIVPKLINLTHLDLRKSEKHHSPRRLLFASALSRLRVYKAHDVLHLEDTDGLDPYKIEQLDLVCYPYFCQSDHIIAKHPWPKLRILKLQITPFGWLLYHVLQNVPNLEEITLWVDNTSIELDETPWDYREGELPELLSRPNLRRFMIEDYMMRWGAMLNLLAPNQEMRWGLWGDDDLDRATDHNDPYGVPILPLVSFCEWCISEKAPFISKLFINSQNLWNFVWSQIRKPTLFPSEAFLERLYQASFPGGILDLNGNCFPDQIFCTLESDDFQNEGDSSRIMIKFAIRILEGTDALPDSVNHPLSHWFCLLGPTLRWMPELSDLVKEKIQFWVLSSSGRSKVV